MSSFVSAIHIYGRAFVFGLFLSACANKPPPPDWKMNAQGASEKALDAYLSGNSRVETLEWNRARTQVARTGQPKLLARLELMRCAAQLASLAWEPCAAFEALRQDADAAEQAYADYLSASIKVNDLALLPPAQRSAALAAPDAIGPTLGAIEDPLSRLVAAGVALRSGRANADVLLLATKTASEQGWRRPLIAWLLVQVQRAEVAGDIASAAALRRRLAIVEQSAAGQRPVN